MYSLKILLIEKKTVSEVCLLICYNQIMSKIKSLKRLKFIHATEWNRTIDLHLTMVLLYRLSYSGYTCAFTQSESNRRGFALQISIYRLKAMLPTLATEL